MKINTKDSMLYGLLVRNVIQLFKDQGYSKGEFDKTLASIAGALDDHWEEEN